MKTNTIFSTFSIYLAGIYFVSLLFGNDLFHFSFRLTFLILIFLISLLNANEIMKYLQSNSFNLNQPIIFFLSLSSISIIFNFIDYKTFLFIVGNISGFLSLVAGLFSFVFKSQYKTINMKLNFKAILLICLMLVIPIISYFCCYEFKNKLGYAFIIILTNMELFGILLFASILFKILKQKYLKT